MCFQSQASSHRFDFVFFFWLLNGSSLCIIPHESNTPDSQSVRLLEVDVSLCFYLFSVIFILKDVVGQYVGFQSSL